MEITVDIRRTYKKWWLFCQQRQSDIYEANLAHIISFLNELYLQNSSYTSLNSHRSALSLILNFSNADENLIKRFLRGVYRTRPVFAKYNTTWDPMPVLSYLKTFTDCPELCVIKTLKAYLLRTNSFRKVNDGYLMLTFKKPHRTATAQSISRWVKQVLEKSGINTHFFHAHSTRHATSSAALRKGLNIDQIKNTIGWTQKSHVFQKFYNRPLALEKVMFRLFLLCTGILYYHLIQMYVLILIFLVFNINY
ncbi:hypothetical protein PPYR_13735 [Photinus pyralis]|uniref:Tyr recombinase domain-containing protein n=1 Tax=Photinus pyralis TaxID=7054 RepID=A0A5N4A9W5_PHOPY|nr:hypothetical protein PPYR_13735 [Photinus pyralis]